jgi:hypothetical protein
MNLMAKLRFFEGTDSSFGTSPKHLLHVLKSLASLCPNMLQGRLVEILSLLCEQIDSAILE